MTGFRNAAGAATAMVARCLTVRGRRWLTLACVLVGLLAILLLIADLGSSRVLSMLASLLHGDFRRLRAELHALGVAAVVALVVLVLAHTVLPFPAEPLEAAAGFTLGLAAALPVLLVSFVVSALVAYGIGASAGRPVVGSLVGAGRLTQAESLVARGGARWLLALRLFPLVPFSPVCIACGLMRVPLRRYLWTTALGILPEMALVTFIGAQLESFHLSDPRVWAPLIGVLPLVVLGPSLLRLGRARG